MSKYQFKSLISYKNFILLLLITICFKSFACETQLQSFNANIDVKFRKINNIIIDNTLGLYVLENNTKSTIYLPEYIPYEEIISGELKNYKNLHYMNFKYDIWQKDKYENGWKQQVFLADSGRAKDHRTLEVRPGAVIYIIGDIPSIRNKDYIYKVQLNGANNFSIFSESFCFNYEESLSN